MKQLNLSHNLIESFFTDFGFPEHEPCHEFDDDHNGRSFLQIFREYIVIIGNRPKTCMDSS